MDVQVITGSPTELAQWFVDDLERALRTTPAHRRFTIAVPGGSVAEAFFPQLAATDLPWHAIDVFWVDERAVEPTDPLSNYALARRLWLAPATVPASNVHRMPAERPDVEQAAKEYARQLSEAAGSPTALDYVLLGVGEDGHVASIFPEDREGMEDAVVSWTDQAPKPPQRRMTLGLATLARGRRVVVAAFGATKRRLVDDVLANRSPDLPLARLLRAANEPVLLVTERQSING